MRKYPLMILLVLSFVVAMSSMSFANDKKFEGACTFDGENITVDFDQNDLAATATDMEPGDTVEYTITYTNDSDGRTEWYMLNSVLETLEESRDQAENGGYTYILKNIGPGNKETVLFNNTVGGETEGVDLEGLKQATNATNEFFHIQRLEKGQSGTTKLFVAFDGETEVNDYMDTSGKLILSYAVESAETDEVVEKVVKKKKPGQPDNPGQIIDTGDRNSLLWPIILNVGAVILLILAIVIHRRERREDGEQA